MCTPLPAAPEGATRRRTEHCALPPAPLAIVIPALNEERSLPELLAEVAREQPGAAVFVVSDGSEDATAEVARRAGATVLDLPYNVGVGGAVQAGLCHAWRQGYRCVVRIDGDGQHPPSEIGRLLEAAASSGADLVVASRFLGEASYGSTPGRRLGIAALSAWLSSICRAPVTDPTSGFWCIRGPLLRLFAHEYPAEYPEPEALALLRRQGYSFVEVPARFRPRRHGESSIGRWGAVYYALRVALALVLDRVRPVNRRFARVWDERWDEREGSAS